MLATHLLDSTLQTLLACLTGRLTSRRTKSMAKSIRNSLTIYGAPDEADRFTGRFLRGGMAAFMPIPPTANPARKYSEIWGACPDGYDIEVLTAESIASVEFRGEDHSRPHLPNGSSDHNWLNYNTCSVADHQDEIRSCALPGFLGQDMTPVALIVFCTQWTFPSRWIEHVVNAEYDRGLIMHMQSYDISNCYVPPEVEPENIEYEHFHSYTSTDSAYIQSGHCAILIHEYRPTFDEVNNGAYDPDLPLIDEDGNAMPLGSPHRAEGDIPTPIRATIPDDGDFQLPRWASNLTYEELDEVVTEIGDKDYFVKLWANYKARVGSPTEKVRP